jgi:hypothetical protein
MLEIARRDEPAKGTGPLKFRVFPVEFFNVQQNKSHSLRLVVCSDLLLQSRDSGRIAKPVVSHKARAVEAVQEIDACIG